MKLKHVVPRGVEGDNFLVFYLCRYKLNSCTPPSGAWHGSRNNNWEHRLVEAAKEKGPRAAATSRSIWSDTAGVARTSLGRWQGEAPLAGWL